jgi:hypothetical protein
MSEGTRPGQGRTVQAVRTEVQFESPREIANQHIWVHGDDGEGRLPCYASRDLSRSSPDIERLIVVVHGALRDSDRYFAHAGDAAGQARAAALIVAPQFLADVDINVLGASPDTLYWGIEGWKGGEPALGPAKISSFRAMDCLLEQLTAAERRPAGRKLVVVIIGNSAGGQYVNRYAAVGRAPDTLAERDIQVRFVIANPSTYLYFDKYRPVPVPDDTGINRWRYGFDEHPPYVKDTPRQSLRRYLERDVTIVLGAEDRDSGALLLEVSAAAMAQGANRLERGIRYGEYIRERARDEGLVARHRVIELSGVGHAAGEVLADQQTREIMFG